MSVSIRLARFGKKNHPTYRVVVTQTRSKRDGSFIDIIGHYNPFNPSEQFTINKELYQDWVGKGAIVSKAVEQLIDGSYEFKKYTPKLVKAKEEKPEESSNEEGA